MMMNAKKKLTTLTLAVAMLAVTLPLHAAPVVDGTAGGGDGYGTALSV
jgi:hypothetical protein